MHLGTILCKHAWKHGRRGKREGAAKGRQVTGALKTYEKEMHKCGNKVGYKKIKSIILLTLSYA